MSVARLAFAVLCGSLVLAGCGPQVPPVGNYATIQGVVRDAVTNQPVAGAVVSVSVVSSSPTGTSGAYKVFPVPTGPYTSIQATAPNYKPFADYTGGTLSPGQVLNVDIAMQPGT